MHLFICRPILKYLRLWLSGFQPLHCTDHVLLDHSSSVPQKSMFQKRVILTWPNQDDGMNMTESWQRQTLFIEHDQKINRCKVHSILLFVSCFTCFLTITFLIYKSLILKRCKYINTHLFGPNAIRNNRFLKKIFCAC